MKITQPCTGKLSKGSQIVKILSAYLLRHKTVKFNHLERDFLSVMEKTDGGEHDDVKIRSRS